MPSQQFTTPRPVRVSVTVPSGDLQILTVDGDQSTVTVEGSEKTVEAMRVELVGDRLVIEQRRKSFVSFFDRFDGSLHVRAQVPHGSLVEIVTASGDAALEGDFGAVQAKSASGDLVVTGDIAGSVNVNGVSGDVRLPHVAGDLSARTVSGHVVADSVDGSVTVKSVSGKVRIGLLRDGSVNVQSVSGDVDLGVAAGTRVDVDAGSASGAMSSEIPLADAPGSDAGPTVVIRSNSVSGDFHLFRAA